MYNPYAVMYDAKMDVYRWEDIEENNITTNKGKLIVDAIPCRYSSSGQTAVGTPSPTLVNSHKLFCGLDVDVKEGDHLVITLKNGTVREVDLGECHPYTYQWQCEIKRGDTV